MKNLTGALLLAVCALTVTSCGKKKNEVNIPDKTYPVGMHAKINGVSWTAEYVNHSSVTGSGHYYLQFDGVDSATDERLSIEIADFTGKSIHNFTSGGDNIAYYSLDTNYVHVPVNASSGQVTITYLNDSTASGTFNFVAGSKTVTDGTFYVVFN